MNKNDPRITNGWAMYDWANSVYPLVITTTIFPIYFTSQAESVMRAVRKDRSASHYQKPCNGAMPWLNYCCASGLEVVTGKLSSPQPDGSGMRRGKSQRATPIIEKIIGSEAVAAQQSSAPPFTAPPACRMPMKHVPDLILDFPFAPMPGEISKVLEDGDNFYIFSIRERKPGDAKAIDLDDKEVQSVIAALMAEERAEAGK